LESLETISAKAISPELRLRTGVWYGDDHRSLPLPAHWVVSVFHPRTPPPLTDAQIETVLDEPCGHPPLHEIFQKKPPRRPLIVVDDPNRPTPAFRVIPFLLKQFQNVGLARSEVRILVASGTHAPPQCESLLRKLGPEAETCQVLIHDPWRDLVRIGTTSLQTPVYVNRQVVESDFVLGIGGIYPNHTAGFGGGSKLVLGALGYRTIMRLHCCYKGLGWGEAPGPQNLHKDLDEIARMSGLRSLICLQVDSDLNIVRVAAGDHFRFYGEEVAFARQAFEAPPSEGADVVISNAYPNDLSLTFVHKKGIHPLTRCSPGASRIVVAACSEGHGYHRLFPYVNYPRLHRARHLVLRASLMTPRELARTVAAKVGRRVLRFLPAHQRTHPNSLPSLNPIWLFRTSPREGDLPVRLPDMQVTSSWETIVKAVDAEQHGKKPLKVYVYPCAPLQWIRPSSGEQELSVES